MKIYEEVSPKTVTWLETTILRGIEGHIADRYLSAVTKGDIDALYDYYESVHMAEQVYAQCKGWGL